MLCQPWRRPIDRWARTPKVTNEPSCAHRQQQWKRTSCNGSLDFPSPIRLSSRDGDATVMHQRERQSHRLDRSSAVNPNRERPPPLSSQSTGVYRTRQRKVVHPTASSTKPTMSHELAGADDQPLIIANHHRTRSDNGRSEADTIGGEKPSPDIPP
jgi:hypothetical protein